MTSKEFVRISNRYEDSRRILASDYVYRVDGQEVFVEVHATVTNQWNAPAPGDKTVSQDEVKQAVEDLIEAEIGKGWCPQKSNRLLLDELSVQPIAIQLSCSAR